MRPVGLNLSTFHSEKSFKCSPGQVDIEGYPREHFSRSVNPEAAFGALPDSQGWLMLSADAITWLCERGDLEWLGRRRGDGLLLTLGSPLLPLAVPRAPVVDLADQASIDGLYGEPVAEWQTYDLGPGEMVLCAVEEPLRLGARLMGVIGGLSHLARVGLAVHVTSPFVLPGWNGHLTLEIVNAGPAVLRLHRGMPVGRVLVFAVNGPRDHEADAHPYYGRDTDLSSRYADEFRVGPSRR